MINENEIFLFFIAYKYPKEFHRYCIEFIAIKDKIKDDLGML
jgi:hypothetical protein